MRIRFVGFKAYLGIVSLAGSLLVVSHAHAGTVSGMDDPNRVPGSFVVVLKRDHIVSLKNPVLTDPHEIAVKSEKWQAAKAAADSEVAQIVAKLTKAHPHVTISAVMSRGEAPGFVLRASDDDARAIAHEEDVAEVDADTMLRNVTLSNKPERSQK
jgi:hypothetical protein